MAITYPVIKRSDRKFGLGRLIYELQLAIQFSWSKSSQIFKRLKTCNFSNVDVERNERESNSSGFSKSYHRGLALCTHISPEKYNQRVGERSICRLDVIRQNSLHWRAYPSPN
ncbi:hypothetical protein TcasGA2_TC012907 [Tribolium castaneum]|uniref:Uncharacterized protein n=1 Tax=Tribolium castaneum TaxID=7070 RepID=D7ELE6_TRICA|nr:hypothetical protein TcasGA2_TC012907 [Tribolium castaneum]